MPAALFCGPHRHGAQGRFPLSGTGRLVAPFVIRAFPVFGEPVVRRYLGGQLASVLGSWTQNITLSLLLWEQTHSALLIGLLNFLLQVPMLFVPPLAGPRMQPATIRDATLRILRGSLVITCLLLLGAASGQLSAWSVLLLAGLQGVVSALEWPARQLLLTSFLRDRSLLVNAVATNSLIFNIGRMTGPAVAAVLYTHYGATTGFVCSLAGLAVMYAAIRGLPRAAETEAARKEPPSLRDGLRFAAGDDFARSHVPALVCLGLFVSSYQTLIPVLAATVFGSASHYTGVFFACAGAGAFSAAIAIAAIRNAQAARRALAWAPWFSASALLAIATSTQAVLSGVGFFVLGMTLVLSTTVINSSLQQRCPPHLRGAMVGLFGMAFMGSIPLGHLLMGQVAHAWGAPTTLLVMGCAVALCQIGIPAVARRLR